MNNRLSFLAIVLLGLTITACDKIEPPYKQGGEVLAERKVLLEDYTGQRCVNCPTAARIAHDLKDVYGENLIVMGIHTGFFAVPFPPQFPLDMRTEAGESWDAAFKISTAGHPKGLVNRYNKEGIYYLGPGEWGTAIADAISKKADATLELEANFTAGNTKIFISANGSFLRSMEGEYFLQLCVLEDSIVGNQNNNDPTVGTTPVIENYVHRHVLRATVNGINGEKISDETVSGDTFSKTYEFAIDAGWKTQHLSVVAWVYRGSDFEILQVEEVHVQSE